MGRALPAGLCSETTSAIMKMLIIANLPHTFMYISSFDPHTTLRSGYPSTPPLINVRKLRPREVGTAGDGEARIQTRASGIVHLLYNMCGFPEGGESILSKEEAWTSVSSSLKWE